jgi:hypothetical protein
VPQIEAENLSLRIGAGQKIEDLKKEFAKEKKELLEKLKTQCKLQVEAVNERRALEAMVKEVRYHTFLELSLCSSYNSDTNASTLAAPRHSLNSQARFTRKSTTK